MKCNPSLVSKTFRNSIWWVVAVATLFADYPVEQLVGPLAVGGRVL